MARISSQRGGLFASIRRGQSEVFGENYVKGKSPKLVSSSRNENWTERIIYAIKLGRQGAAPAADSKPAVFSISFLAKRDIANGDSVRLETCYQETMLLSELGKLTGSGFPAANHPFWDSSKRLNRDIKRAIWRDLQKLGFKKVFNISLLVPFGTTARSAALETLAEGPQ